MEVTGGEEEGFVREWTPCSHMLSLIPLRVQMGLFSNELCLTCIDAVTEYIALGTNYGLVYWYDRKKGTIQRLRCEASSSPITYVKIVNTVDYMVGAGNAAGQVTVFQIPKEHPENVPDTFKPKVEPKVERYTIGELHKSKITSIEWSKNGMRLFSGDKNGVIIMTEIDFYMHLCKSMEIVNEEHEIVQMSYHQNVLLVSSLYRSIVCERDGATWRVCQIGRKERKSLCRLGAVFQHSYARGGGGGAGGATLYCARAGLRLWRADKSGEVLQTLLFKEAISNPLTIAELLNPSLRPHSQTDKEYNLGPLYPFREHFLVSHNEDILYVLDPRSLTAVAVLDQLRRILSVSVNRDEIFVLEGARSVLRLGHAPESAAAHAEEAMLQMTKSLTESIQHAVSTVQTRTAPFISSVLEQPISLLTRSERLDSPVASAEECFELPPVKQLPPDMASAVLESIGNEFKDVAAETEELRKARSDELQKKLKLYNSIMEKQCDAELIHSSRRSRRREGGGTPRGGTPVRGSSTPVRGGGERNAPVSVTSACVMSVSVYGNLPQETDDILEKQIEEKEKILAKMLNLESLSIQSTKLDATAAVDGTNGRSSPLTFHHNGYQKPVNEPIFQTPTPIDKPVTPKPVPKKLESNKISDLLPKVVMMPNNWNLGTIELNLESDGYKRPLMSPDDNLENEWEFV